MTILNSAANKARNDYYKRYRANNQDKIRNINKKYWERRALREVGEIDSVCK